MICYGKLGDNGVYRYGTGIEPESWAIEMQSERPDVWYVAQADGTWVEDIDLKAEWEASQSEP